MAENFVSDRDLTVEPALAEIADDPLAAGLAVGDTARAERLFYGAGARPPRIVWSPGIMDLGDQAMISFLQHSKAAAGPKLLPPIEGFDPLGLPQRRWLMLLTPLASGRDYRYVHYGDGVAEYYGRSMKGRRASEIGGHISRFFIALYRAAALRREIVLSEHEPPSKVFVKSWRRLIVPLAGADDEVAGFAVVNLPENPLREGLEVLPFPCVLADANRVICFANAAARRLANLPPDWEHGVSIDIFLGHRLELPDDPSALLQPTPLTITETARLRLPGLGDASCEITTGAARYRDMALFVITLREAR